VVVLAVLPKYVPQTWLLVGIFGNNNYADNFSI